MIGQDRDLLGAPVFESKEEGDLDVPLVCRRQLIYNKSSKFFLGLFPKK